MSSLYNKVTRLPPNLIHYNPSFLVHSRTTPAFPPLSSTLSVLSSLLYGSTQISPCIISPILLKFLDPTFPSGYCSITLNTFATKFLKRVASTLLVQFLSSIFFQIHSKQNLPAQLPLNSFNSLMTSVSKYNDQVSVLIF